MAVDRIAVKDYNNQNRLFFEAIMATATQGKKQKAAPPKASGRKDNPVNVEFEDQAKKLLKYAMAQRKADYAALSEGLAAMGVEISIKGLENKISRGGFSAAFFLQCMEAMEINVATLPR